MKKILFSTTLLMGLSVMTYAQEKAAGKPATALKKSEKAMTPDEKDKQRKEHEMKILAEREKRAQGDKSDAELQKQEAEKAAAKKKEVDDKAAAVSPAEISVTLEPAAEKAVPAKESVSPEVKAKKPAKPAKKG